MIESMELDCAKYRVTGGSIGYSRGVSIFRCTISPVSDGELERLSAAARSNGKVWLLFPNKPLLLERVEIDPVESGSIRIAGRVIDGHRDAT